MAEDDIIREPGFPPLSRTGLAQAVRRVQAGLDASESRGGLQCSPYLSNPPLTTREREMLRAMKALKEASQGVIRMMQPDETHALTKAVLAAEPIIARAETAGRRG